MLCCAESLSRVRLFATPWTAARQAPLSMGTLQAGIRSGLPCFPPGDPPNPGIEPRSPILQVDSLPSESLAKPSTGVVKWFFPAKENSPVSDNGGISSQ